MEKDPKAAENPPYGERGAFRKITVTLAPEDYESLVLESTRRKIAGEPNRQITCLLREAIVGYLRRRDEEN